MAITPAGMPVSAATQATKQRWNASASRAGEDVAEVVVRRRAVRERAEAPQEDGSFFSPKRAMSVKVSAPASTASRARSSTSSSG